MHPYPSNAPVIICCCTSVTVGQSTAVPFRLRCSYRVVWLIVLIPVICSGCGNPWLHTCVVVSQRIALPRASRDGREISWSITHWNVIRNMFSSVVSAAEWRHTAAHAMWLIERASEAYCNYKMAMKYMP